ncbi:MAG: toxin TcdB middle/N-terminal domain-containing protein, partial [Pseudomonadota bacterium]
INGDGKSDLVFGLPYGNDIVLKSIVSNGVGFSEVTESRIYNWASMFSRGKYLPMDINGDGKSDVVFALPYGNDIVLKSVISNGVGFSEVTESRIYGWASIFDSAQYLPMDINGDGKSDLVFGLPYANDIVLKSIISNGAFPDLLATVTYGPTTTLTYKPLTNPTVYTKDTTSTYPTQDIQPALYVVSQVSTSNGVGGNFTTDYTYGGLKQIHANSGCSTAPCYQGSLGFRWMQSYVAGTIGIRTLTTYSQTFPYIGMPVRMDKYCCSAVTAQTLTRINNTPSYVASTAYGTYVPYLAKNVQDNYELSSAYVSSVTTTTQIDSFGNPTTITETTNDNNRKTTTHTYTNDTANWQLGKLTQAQVTSTLANGQSATRTSSFRYDYNGFLNQEVIEPNNTLYRLQTDYTYDAYGNRKTATVSGADILTRTTTTDFTARLAGEISGRFPTTVTNAVGHTETREYDPRFGSVTKLTGPNGLATQWQYDGFGRKVLETRADGTTTRWDFLACDAYKPTGCARLIATTASGQPASAVYLDSLSREIRNRVVTFDGRNSYVDTVYDGNGRVYTQSRPYFAGATVFYYDRLGRVTKQVAADNSVTVMGYNGLMTYVTDPLNHYTIQHRDTLGRLAKVTDASDKFTTYTYDPFGNLLQTVDAAGNKTIMAYDTRGRKTRMTDPNMGYWKYEYNVLG